MRAKEVEGRKRVTFGARATYAESASVRQTTLGAAGNGKWAKGTYAERLVG